MMSKVAVPVIGCYKLLSRNTQSVRLLRQKICQRLQGLTTGCRRQCLQLLTCFEEMLFNHLLGNRQRIVALEQGRHTSLVFRLPCLQPPFQLCPFRRRAFFQDCQQGHDEELVELVSQHTPRRDAGLAELQEKLNEAMQKLSEDHRTVVTLHDVQGLSHEEIGKIMDCNTGTVRSRLFYARQQLQAYLSDYLK